MTIEAFANPSGRRTTGFRALRTVQVPILFLATATALWGLTNVVQKLALEEMGPFTVIAARCWLGALALMPLALRERARASPSPALRRDPSVVIATFSFCTGLCLQQVSAGLTTATNMGFIINSCAAIVPFIVWMTGSDRPTVRTLTAAAVTVAGVTLLSGFSSNSGVGDFVCLASALSYAGWVVAVGRAVANNVAACGFTMTQLLFTAGFATLAALVIEEPSAQQFIAIAPGILFLGIFGTGVSFALAAHAQRGLGICATAIIMNLESVFTAVASHIVMGEVLALAALGGGLMILAGCLIVQLKG